MINCLYSLLALIKLILKSPGAIYQHRHEVANPSFVIQQKYTSDQLNKIIFRIHRRSTHIYLSCIPVPPGPFNYLTPNLVFSVWKQRITQVRDPFRRPLKIYLNRELSQIPSLNVKNTLAYRKNICRYIPWDSNELLFPPFDNIFNFFWHLSFVVIWFYCI